MKFNEVMKDIYESQVENLEISEERKEEILKNIEKKTEGIKEHKPKSIFSKLRNNYRGIAAVSAFALVLVLIPVGARYINKAQQAALADRNKIAKQSDTTKPTNNGDISGTKKIDNNTTGVKDNQQVKYTKYTNDKFSYSLEYPSTLIEKTITDTDTEKMEKIDDNEILMNSPDGTTEIIPTNGSGEVLQSPDGSAELIVIGDNHPQNITVEQEYNETLLHHTDIVYKKQEGNWYVVSWIDSDGNIVYLKDIVGVNHAYYFKITYPSDQKDYYDAIVAHLNSSFIINESNSGANKVVNQGDSTIGNSAGNIGNRGLVAVQGDYIYYQEPADGFKLYKKGLDGSGITKLSDHSASNINVVGDWIYYLDFKDWYNAAIYKIKTDGTEETKIYDANKSSAPSSNEDAWDMTVIGDWIYFHDDFYNDCMHDYMFRIKTDGTEKTQITSDAVGHMATDGQWIYYENLTDNLNGRNKGKLYKVKVDGTNKTKLSDESVYSNIDIKDGNIIYCSDCIVTMKPDGTSTVITKDTGESINVVGDNIYYTFNNKIYRININGQNKVQIADSYAVDINIAGNSLYYLTNLDAYNVLKLFVLPL